MNKKQKVRRKVITPHGEYIGMWREQETYGYIDLAISDHPQCPVEKIKIDKGKIQNKVLSIELYTPDGGHIYIPSSIVEKSIVICEFSGEQFKHMSPEDVLMDRLKDD